MKKVKKFNHQAVLDLINEYADCVQATYGPNGSNVLLRSKDGQVIVTKDGVTVSDFISYEEETQQAVIEILKMAAKETVNKVGDGTTSTVIVSRALLRELEGLETTIQNVGRLKFKHLLDEFSTELKNEVLNHAITGTMTKEVLRNIINVSSNGDSDITDVLYKAVVKTGLGSSIVVENSKDLRTTLEFREGYDMPSGYYGPSFVNNRALDCIEFDNPTVLITDGIIEDRNQLLKIISINDKAKKPFVIIADDVRGEAMALCAYNAQQGVPLAVLKSPSFGLNRVELLQDLAASLGATFVSISNNLTPADVELKHCGTCRKMVATSKSTRFLEPEGDTQKVAERISQLQARITATEDKNEIERLVDRSARLSAITAVVKVGGLSDAERTERRHRIDDALEAVRSAETTGYVPGGGTYYHFMATKKLPEIAERLKESFSADLVDQCSQALKEALLEPLKVLASTKYDEVLNTLKDNDDPLEFEGFDFRTGKKVEMLKSGIIEPVNLVVNVITNSISAAGILATLGYSVTETKDE